MKSSLRVLLLAGSAPSTCRPLTPTPLARWEGGEEKTEVLSAGAAQWMTELQGTPPDESRRMPCTLRGCDSSLVLVAGILPHCDPEYSLPSNRQFRQSHTYSPLAHNHRSDCCRPLQ